MIVCPQCKASNPDWHKFCQQCGVSLVEHACSACQTKVSYEEPVCTNCGQETGVFHWGIVSHLSAKTAATVEIEEPPTTDRQDENVDSPPADASTEAVESVAEDEGEPIVAATEDAPQEGDSRKLDDKEEEVPVLAAVDPDTAEETTETKPTGDEVTEAEVSPAAAVAENTSEKPPDTTTSFFDKQGRYMIVSPEVAEYFKAGDAVCTRILDRRPLQTTPLQVFLEQCPPFVSRKTMGGEDTWPDGVPTDRPQWTLWESGGIPESARPYLALSVDSAGIVPPIVDAWRTTDREFVIIEDRSKWPTFIQHWCDSSIPSPTLYWLNCTVKLWHLLSPWQMRQSLLALENLRVDEDGRLCLQQLHLEPVEPSLADLGKVWLELLRLAPERTTPELKNLIDRLLTGKIETTTDLHEELRQLSGLDGELDLPTATGDITMLRSSADLGATTQMLVYPKTYTLTAAATTHVGQERDHNEDCFGVHTWYEYYQSPQQKCQINKGLYILCDGMGGHASGEVASSMTVTEVEAFFERMWRDIIPSSETISAGILTANQMVYDINQNSSAAGKGRMGTTLVMALVQDGTIAIAHVGDSRGYRITTGSGLECLTTDHEVAQRDILRGVSADIANARPDAHQLTQAIGPRPSDRLMPDVNFFDVTEDCLIILASDGLTDNDFLEHNWETLLPLLDGKADLTVGVQDLVNAANAYNGHDNITAIVARVGLVD